MSDISGITLNGVDYGIEGGGGGGAVDSVNGQTGVVNLSASDVSALPIGGGTMGGNIAMGSHKITGLADGSANTDAVNKKQVEDAIAALGEVLDFKGAVQNVSDLPSSGNTGGDVYYVRSIGAMFVWVETGVGGAYEWDEMGEHFDMSGYIPTPSSPSVDQVLSYDGSDWVAKTITPEVTNSSTGSVTQALDAEKVYHFTGAITALTITLNTPSANQLAHYHFDFLSGSTAATLTMPSTVTMPDSFAVEASKRYEVDVLNNYGAVMTWANS